jgi:colanic acid/amylovoran biosynthesis glycosyltransferase
MTLPRTAYIALWFPKPSETFVVSEVRALSNAGLPLSVHTLYGPLKNAEALPPEGISVEHLGLAALPRIALSFLAALATRPRMTLTLIRRTLCAPGQSAEKYGENLLAVFCGFSLARRFRKLGVEHVHAAWACGSATAAWCAATLLGIPFSFSARAGDVHPPDGLLRLKLRSCAFARVDSAYNLPHLYCFIPEDQRKIHLVYNARTLAPTEEASVDMAAPLRLVAIGRFIETKGFQHLIEALALLRRRGFEARLTLAGDGAWRGQLKALVKHFGLQEFVRFPGFVPHDEVSGLLREADMLVMPSLLRADGAGDGLPTVIAEAFLHRLPVVASNVASIPDLVIHEQTGLLVPERDPEALAEAIIRMAADRDAALTMAKNGRELTLRMFAPETCAAGLLRLLAGEVDGKRGPQPWINSPVPSTRRP